MTSRPRLAGLFLILCAALAASGAQAAETVKYLLPAPLSVPAFGPWVVAKQLGYYEAAGYDVQFIVARGGVDVAKQIGVGNADIGGAIGDTPILVRANGIPVKAIAVLGGGALTIVTARPDRGIKTLADLKGKHVGVLSFEDTTYYALLGSLAAVGLHKGDVDIQAAGPAGTVGLVVAGTADACACTPDWSLAVQDGVPGAIAIPTIDFFPSMAQAILASDSAIAARPEMLRAMVGATLRGLKLIMDDPDKAAEAYVAATPSMAGKKDQMVRIFKAYTARTYSGQNRLGEVDARRLAEVEKFYLDQGFVRSAPAVETLYSNAFLPAP